MVTEKDNTFEYIKAVFEHNQDLIGLADSKANIVVGMISVLLPVIFGVEVLTFLDEDQIELQMFMFSTFIILVILFTISFMLSIFTIHPRLKENYDDSIFFQNIVKKTVKDYISFIESIKDDIILKDYALEAYALAEINCKKFRTFKYSLLFLVIGIFLLSFRYILFFGILILC